MELEGYLVDSIKFIESEMKNKGYGLDPKQSENFFKSVRKGKNFFIGIIRQIAVKFLLFLRFLGR